MRMRGLPPGFRFEPTEEELVFEYLKCKVFSSALPASIIPEINLCNFDPWDLEGDETEEIYLFCNKVKLGSKYGRRWSSPSGYWKATRRSSSDRKIISCCSSNMDHVGMKKTLVFYTNKLGGRRSSSSSSSIKTAWRMHEYRLISTSTSTNNNNMAENDKWVLCRIFCKKLPNNNNNQFQSNNNNNNSSSCSSSSSTPATSYSDHHFSAS